MESYSGKEPTVNRMQSNEVTLTLTVPEYSSNRVSLVVRVYFCLQRMDEAQSFKFLPMMFKKEPLHSFP